MKNKRIRLIGLMSAALLILSPLGGVLAADTASDPQLISAPAPGTGADSTWTPDPAPTEKPTVTYHGFAGKITGVAEGTPQVVTVENDEGGQAEFIITADTYLFDGAEITEGGRIIGYYDASLPMTLQYPPRYSVPAAAPVTDEYSVFVGLFNEALVSADNQLALLNTDAAEIVSVNGEKYTGALAGRRLAVTYKVVTMSLPGQTTPLKIVVLPEPAQEQPAEQQPTQPALTDVSQMPIVVNQTAIDNPPPPYINDGGAMMLPLRITAEALGFDVYWDPVQRTAALGRIITVTADRDYYVYARTAPIELGVAPEIKDGRIYAPLSFFTEVARLQTAEVQNGQIILTGAVPSE
jgi:hypothetical protein